MIKVVKQRGVYELFAAKSHSTEAWRSVLHHDCVKLYPEYYLKRRKVRGIDRR